jgi:ABC-type Na+ efflux pump permease subunit
MRSEMWIFPRVLRFWTALAMVLLIGAIDAAPAAAGLTASTLSGATEITSLRDADMVVAQRVLENKVVAQKLRDYGVSPEEAKLRLASMSDQDLHTLASTAKGLPTGGDDAIGLLIGILVIVLLVILILKLMNKEVVVK